MRLGCSMRSIWASMLSFRASVQSSSSRLFGVSLLKALAVAFGICLLFTAVPADAANNRIVGNKNNSASTQTQWITHRLAAPVNAVAVRMVIYAGGGNGVNVSELEVYSTSSKVGGITGTATSNHPNGTYDAPRAFDGLAYTHTDTGCWYSAGLPSESNPVMLMGKFGSAHDVTHVRFVSSGYDVYRQPLDYEIQFSSDPSAVAGDHPSSSRWFGVDLTNGKSDGTEAAMSVELANSPIAPSAGKAQAAPSPSPSPSPSPGSSPTPAPGQTTNPDGSIDVRVNVGVDPVRVNVGVDPIQVNMPSSVEMRIPVIQDPAWSPVWVKAATLALKALAFLVIAFVLWRLV